MPDYSAYTPDEILKAAYPDKKLKAVKIGDKHAVFHESVADAISKADADMRKATGKGLQINSSFRTNDQQKSAWNRYQSGEGGLAARPGRSRHEKGLAVDVANWKEAVPYLSKYGLVNPFVGRGDPVHFQLSGGLKPSVKVDGKQYDGEMGQKHDDVIRANNLKQGDEKRGFIGSDGKFMDRTSAKSWVKGNQPDVYDKLPKGEMHSQHYRDALGIPPTDISKARNMTADASGKTVPTEGDNVTDTSGLTIEQIYKAAGKEIPIAAKQYSGYTVEDFRKAAGIGEDSRQAQADKMAAETRQPVLPMPGQIGTPVQNAPQPVQQQLQQPQDELRAMTPEETERSKARNLAPNAPLHQTVQKGLDFLSDFTKKLEGPPTEYKPTGNTLTDLGNITQSGADNIVKTLYGMANAPLQAGKSIIQDALGGKYDQNLDPRNGGLLPHLLSGGDKPLEEKNPIEPLAQLGAGIVKGIPDAISAERNYPGSGVSLLLPAAEIKKAPRVGEQSVLKGAGGKYEGAVAKPEVKPPAAETKPGEIVTDALSRAVSPKVEGKRNIKKIGEWYKSAENAMKEITWARREGKLDKPDSPILGRVRDKSSMLNFADDLDKTFWRLVEENNADLKAAGKETIVDHNHVLGAMKKREQELRGLTSPGSEDAANYAQAFIDRIENHGPYNLEQVYKEIKSINNNPNMKSFMQNANPDFEARVATDGVFVDALREGLYKTVEGEVGPGFKDRRMLMRDIKRIEPEVAHRAIVNMRRPDKGFFNVTDPLAYAHIARAVATGNIPEALMGGVIKGTSIYNRMKNNRDNIIRKAFDDLNKNLGPREQYASASPYSPSLSKQHKDRAQLDEETKRLENREIHETKEKLMAGYKQAALPAGQGFALQNKPRPKPEPLATVFKSAKKSAEVMEEEREMMRSPEGAKLLKERLKREELEAQKASVKPQMGIEESKRKVGETGEAIKDVRKQKRYERAQPVDGEIKGAEAAKERAEQIKAAIKPKPVEAPKPTASRETKIADKTKTLSGKVKAKKIQDQIKETVAAVKSEKKIVQVKTSEGKKPVTAKVIGDFAYHRPLGYKPKTNTPWAVTHGPSGMDISGAVRISSETEAKELAFRLSYIDTQWDGKGKTPKEFLDAYNKVLEDFNERRPISSVHSTRDRGAAKGRGKEAESPQEARLLARAGGKVRKANTGTASAKIEEPKPPSAKKKWKEIGGDDED